MALDLQAGMVFLGAPGAGKGTQAKMLTKAHQVLHISTGDMLREHCVQGTELGKQAQVFMDRGDLVPDDVMIGMVAERIQRPDAAKAWILDGFPRTLAQAEALDAALAGSDQCLAHVIYFQVPQDALVQRLTARWTCSGCGEIWNVISKPPSQAGVCDACQGELTQRADDRPEAVTVRLDNYRSQTEPLLGYYRTKGVLREIDANRSPDQVFAGLLEALAVPDASDNH
ncbi:MAG: adenylate kinase [Planctomycetota bacterium]|jgi:adenylate kinase